MGDIVKRTAFYRIRKVAGKEIPEYMPFYRVETIGSAHSQLYQPINFQPRKVGANIVSIGAKIQVDEYQQITEGLRFFMDGNQQLMKFQSCEWPIA
jgi:hypothetical protein